MLVAKVVACCLALASLTFGVTSAGLAWWILKHTNHGGLLRPCS